jgi:uncharacterized protein YutE (UPF0331/DUF86 family)/predicted nucleotidyltransferase
VIREETGIRLGDIENRLDGVAQALAGDGIRLACLFGSVLDKPIARDIDLAVWFQDYTFDRYLKVWEAVTRALGTSRVHLVVLNRASAPLKLRALLGGRPLFAETPTAWTEAREEALFEYQDYRRLIVQYRPLFERRCREGLSVAERRMDRDRVEAYLSALDQAVAQLRRLRERFGTLEEFRRDLDTRELCVHYIRIALESVLDTCRHFLATVGVSLSELETTNLIELAAERGLLQPAFGEKIRGMAGMRNAIVHVYWRLDYQAIYRAITDQLPDFDEFARQVQTYEQRQG